MILKNGTIIISIHSAIASGDGIVPEAYHSDWISIHSAIASGDQELPCCGKTD